MRKKTTSLSISIPKKELFRNDTITSTPKILELKPRETGSITLVFTTTDNTFPLDYASIVTLLLEMEGKKKKTKCTSQYFVHFTVTANLPEPLPTPRGHMSPPNASLTIRKSVKFFAYW